MDRFSTLQQKFLPFLLELRVRIIYCLVVWLGIFLLLLPFANSLYHHLSKPLLLQLPSNRLIATSLTAPLFIPFKTSAVASIFFSMPFLLHQFWLFVSPALYFKEKQIIWFILILSSCLFYIGVFFSYLFLLPLLIMMFI
jgi:sec-independent protein translocase protein TatC